MESWRSPKNHIIPHPIGKTLSERQMKYPQIVEALEKMLYLTGKLGNFLLRRAAANGDTL